MPTPHEHNLAPADALKDGELKAFPVADTQVLLVRHAGQYRAFAAHCPHYGAPLEKGRLVGEQLVCPWHHACFRATDGNLCEPPALDNLPAYPVREAEGRVWVTLPPAAPTVPESPDATPTAETGGAEPADAPAAKTADQRTFVIVGAGAAGQLAAQTLRTEGFAGRVVLLGAEPDLPYDRTKLSKAYLAGKADDEQLPLRPADFYQRHRIERQPDARVTGLDAANKQLQLADEPALPYDALLLCPGSVARTLPAEVPGHDLPGVFVLRSHADARRLREAARDARHVVVIGGSFIGMEAAASLAGQQGRSVTVLARESEPFEKVLGSRIGAMFRELHAGKGVTFRGEAAVAELRTGPTGQLSTVVLKSGETLPADLVVLGIGVRPATDFLQEALPLTKDGGLQVDQHLRVAQGIWAAGDVAAFELHPAGGRTRIEHWRVAQQQGQVAALNMLGRSTSFDKVPFFWTQQFGKSLRYAGHASRWDDIIYHGEVEKQDFLALYVAENSIVAAAAINRDPDMICIEALLQLDRMPTPDESRAGVDWAALLQAAQNAVQP